MKDVWHEMGRAMGKVYATMGAELKKLRKSAIFKTIESATTEQMKKAALDALLGKDKQELNDFIAGLEREADVVGKDAKSKIEQEIADAEAKEKAEVAKITAQLSELKDAVDKKISEEWKQEQADAVKLVQEAKAKG